MRSGHFHLLAKDQFIKEILAEWPVAARAKTAERTETVA
jgi:hypothetical protein